jgi:hypothetical protein
MVYIYTWKKLVMHPVGWLLRRFQVTLHWDKRLPVKNIEVKSLVLNCGRII